MSILTRCCIIATLIFASSPAQAQETDPRANVNAKYTVEHAGIRGVPDRAIPARIRADLLALVGQALDSALVEQIETQLTSAFADYYVQRRTSRGSRSGQINVIFQLTRTEQSRWLRFDPMDAGALYHSDQGWGGKLPLTVTGGDFRVVPHAAFDVGDDLIEEYSGFGLRVESRRLGTDRLGVSFEWSTYDQTWRDETLAAVAASPLAASLSRNRMTVTPVLKFAITPRLTVSGGVSIAELDALDESSSESLMANAAIGALTFSQRWRETSTGQHDLNAGFVVRAGTDALESDVVYERYLGQVHYGLRWDRHRVFASGMAGGISGDAPLFERFSLGDSRTLRGWNKYDIAPAGGDRMFHASLEYQYRRLALFVDSGSVWNTDTDRTIRFSTGVGLHAGPVFATVGFPINTDEFRAVFTMGIRFSTSAAGARQY